MRLSQTFTQLRILHVALLASLVINGVVVWVVKPPAPVPTIAVGQVEATPGTKADTPDPALFLPVFAGIAAVELFVVLPLLRRRLLPRRAPFPQPLDDLELDGDERASAAVARLRTASIVSWALGESVALFGVVAAFLLREPRYYLPFGVVGAIAMIVLAPRRSVFDEVVRAAQQDQGTPG